jgi:hypothetical protein
MTQPSTQSGEPPLSPERTQWSDDGTTWWDGTTWIPRAAVPQRQAELEVEAAERLRAEQADYAVRYAEWQVAQAEAAHDGNPFATPGAPGAVPPPPVPPGMALAASAPDTGTSNGYALGMTGFAATLPGTIALAWALIGRDINAARVGLIVCPVLGLVAVVLGHVSRHQARKARLSKNIWSRWSLLFGYTQLVVFSGVMALALAWLSSPANTPVGNSLENAAIAEQVWRSAYGSYTPSMNDLAVTHYRPDPGVTVSVESASDNAFCLRGQQGTEVLWLRSGGSVSKDPCR